MRIIETKVYTFDELSDEAKEKAIENNRMMNVEYWEWWHSVYEIFKDEYSEYFDITNMYFSGFWSQGDGAMFEYEDITTKLFNEIVDSLAIDESDKALLKEFTYVSKAKGTHSGHYYHEKCCSHSFDMNYDSDVFVDTPKLDMKLDTLVDSCFNDIEVSIVEWYEDACKTLYHRLEDEYEYHTSDEAISEILSDNEYEFTENGEMI